MDDDNRVVRQAFIFLINALILRSRKDSSCLSYQYMVIIGIR